MDWYQVGQKIQGFVRNLFLGYCEQKSRMNLGKIWSGRVGIEKIKFSDRLNVGYRRQEVIEDNVEVFGNGYNNRMVEIFIKLKLQKKMGFGINLLFDY